MPALASKPIQNEQKTTYKTIIISGHVIEVREYERAPSRPNFIHEDDYDPFHNIDLLEKEHPGYMQAINNQNYLDNQRKAELLRGDRKAERRQQTVRDARNNVRRLALANFGPSDKFITLTYKKNMKDIEQADKDFKNFIKRFKYHFDITDLKYIAVREFQKRGAIHFHLICDWNKYFSDESEIRKFERLLGKEIWKQGFVDIKQTSHIDNIGAYISKYMTKNVSVEFFKNKKIYLCSKGLKKSIKLTGEEAEKYFIENNLEKEKEVFQNEYPTEYNGLCNFKEYNKLRQK